MKNPLLDTQFLLELDKVHNKIIYVRIISLTQDEQPIEQIEGVVQSGSINVDGKSAIRRSCSLTLTTKLLNINEIYWGFNTKIKIEVGVENNINVNYSPIIWFKQGVFVLTNFKTSQQVNNYTITLNGKDKMCLLNGDISGHFNAETNLKVENYVDLDGEVHETIQPIKYIIREMIHHYAGEPWSNIIINNVDDYGLELLDYRNTNDENSSPLYLWRNEDGVYTYLTTNDMTDTGLLNASYSYNDNSCTSFQELNDFIFINGVEEDANLLIGDITPSILAINIENTTKYYQIFKINNMSTAGYRTTDLVYDKELIAAAGDTITSVLDKIVKMLGPFEYFYNLDGQFVFQAKPTYLNTTWQATEDLDTIQPLSYIEPAVLQTKVSYYFENGNLLTAIQNNPNMLNIRNDFTIWGKKRTSSGSEVPIHARYAIDTKPLFYKSIGIDNGNFKEEKAVLYVTTEGKQLLGLTDNDNFIEVDWRELIYQMAHDYYQANHSDLLEITISNNNKQFSNRLNIKTYLNGKTGYEQYYHDIEGFWRLLYDYNSVAKIDAINSGINDPEQHVTVWENEKLGVTYGKDGWNILVTQEPSDLLFWFDFYDTNLANIDKFNVTAIGDRTKVVNDDNVRTIIYPDTPDIIYISPTDYNIAITEHSLRPGYSYMTLSDDKLKQYFSLSTRKKSAKETMDNLLYAHSHTNDTISLTSIPIYYLQPNSIIHVYDELSHINGYYEITKLTIPLTHNGTMNISAAKIPQQIY